MTDSGTADDGPLPSTLGELLDAAGRRLAARHLVARPWATSLQPALQRVAELDTRYGHRFERREGPPAGHVIGRRPAPGSPDPQLITGSIVPDDTVPDGAAPGSPAPAEPGDSAAATGRPLPADIRTRLRDVAGAGADAVRVHTSPAADAVARAHRADAVTMGADVHLRAGWYRPDEPAGFALLAHEAAHVTALLDPGRVWRRTGAGGADGEEDAALAIEAAAWPRAAPGGLAPGAADRPPVPAGPQRPWPASPPARPAAQPGGAAGGRAAEGHPAQARPMPAPADRDTGPPAPFDVEELRRSLISDVMRQLRTDFERGG
jgi:Domain of unknown function (DUF4157)